MNFILCYVVIACTIMNINRKGGSVAYSRTRNKLEQKKVPSMETSMRQNRHNISQLGMENDRNAINARQNKYHEFLLSTGCCTKLCTMDELLDKLHTKNHRKHQYVKVPLMKSYMKQIRYKIPKFCLKNKRQAIVTHRHKHPRFLLPTGCCTKSCTRVELLDKLCTNNNEIDEKSTEPEKVIETTTTHEEEADEEIVTCPPSGDVQENVGQITEERPSNPMEVKSPPTNISKGPPNIQITTQSPELGKAIKTTTTHKEGADENNFEFPPSSINYTQENIKQINENSPSKGHGVKSLPTNIKTGPSKIPKITGKGTELQNVIETTTTHKEGANDKISKFSSFDVSNGSIIQENAKQITEESTSVSSSSLSNALEVISPPTNISTGSPEMTQITEKSTEPEKVIETTTTHKEEANGKISKFSPSGVSNGSIIQENAKQITEESTSVSSSSLSNPLEVISTPKNISTGPPKMTQTTEQSTEPAKVLKTTTTHKEGADEDL